MGVQSFGAGRPSYSTRMPLFGMGKPLPSSPPASNSRVGLSGWSPLDAFRLHRAKPINVPVATEALNRLAGELVAANGVQQPVFVHVVEQPGYNARALSNGVIMVHVDLLKQATSPEELAFVVAHEISHRHLQHHEQHNLSGGAAIFGGAAACGVLRGMLPSALQRQSGLVGLGVRLGVGLLAWAGLMKQHRRHELQADLNAARLLSKAGYSPFGYRTLMAQVAEGEEDRPLSSKVRVGLLGRSHPPVAVREAALEQLTQTELSDSAASRTWLSPEAWAALRQAVGASDDEI